MPFSQRCTICVAYKLQKTFTIDKKINFFTFDLDLQVTLTLELVLVEYKHTQVKFREI